MSADRQEVPAEWPSVDQVAQAAAMDTRALVEGIVPLIDAGPGPDRDQMRLGAALMLSHLTSGPTTAEYRVAVDSSSQEYVDKRDRRDALLGELVARLSETWGIPGFSDEGKES